MDFVIFGENKLAAKFAITTEEQAKGLMFCEEDVVMAFLYKDKNYHKFWMKNTPKPLDLVFCRDNEVVDIRKGVAFSLSLISSGEVSDLVIELPLGTVEKLNITTGCKVDLELSIETSIKKFNYHKG